MNAWSNPEMLSFSPFGLVPVNSVGGFSSCPSYMPIIASNRGKAPFGKFFPGIATLGESNLKIFFPENPRKESFLISIPSQ